MLDTPATDFAPLTAAAIAAAVKSGQSSAVRVVEAAIARIRERDPLLNSFTAVTEQRALLRAEAIDATRARGEPLGPLAGVPFAVKNLFDIAGLTDPRRLEDQSRPSAGAARRDADRAARSGRRHPSRRAEYGRIRLRLHRREHSRRPLAQSARPRSHDRRLVRRLGSGGRRRPRAARARLRYQRLDPRAVVAVRHFRIEADLRPAVAGAQLSVRREPRSSRPVCAQRARSRAGLSTPCKVSIPTIRSAPTARSSRSCHFSSAAPTGCASPSPSGYFKCKSGEACYAIDRVAAALGANRDIEIPQAERARAAAFIITATEGASLHLDRLRKRAGDFDPAVRDRLIAGAHDAGFAGGQGAEIPPLVSRSRFSNCSRKSTPSWRRRRHARRR